jgi:hypothetical protein
MKNRETIIKNYIEGYNQFNIDKMVYAFDDNIIFENIQNDKTNMSLNGIVEFRLQAEQAIAYFSKREQKIKSFNHTEKTTEIEIDYEAVLGMDFPNGLKKGQQLNLIGKSVFEFEGNKIIKLTDIS